MPLLSHITAGAGGSGRLLESQPVGGKEHCEPIPLTPSAHHDDRQRACPIETSQELGLEAPSQTCRPSGRFALSVRSALTEERIPA
jgi:hypothetical protein